LFIFQNKYLISIFIIISGKNNEKVIFHLNFFGCEKNPLPGPAAAWQILADDLHPGFGSGFFLHPARGRLRSVALNPLPAICQFCETLVQTLFCLAARNSPFKKP
jgi:hypothetical protein